MNGKVFKVFIISLLWSTASFGSYLKCVSSDFERVFHISPMLKKDLLAPGKHRDKTASFALIRMLHQGKVKEQELNQYKVTEKEENIKIKAKSKFKQNNIIARAFLTKVLKRIPDFRINLDLSTESQDGSGQISLLEENGSDSKLKRNKYEVYCKKH